MGVVTESVLHWKLHLVKQKICSAWQDEYRGGRWALKKRGTYTHDFKLNWLGVYVNYSTTHD